MNKNSLRGKTYLVTGGAHRVGALISLAIAQAGGNVIIHYNSSENKAKETYQRIKSLGVDVWLIKANLEDEDACVELIKKSFQLSSLDGLINNAAYFESGSLDKTSVKQWNKHLQLNLTAPFLLSKEFSQMISKDKFGTIVNIVDICTKKPRTTHVAYSLSKMALENLTNLLAKALAPKIGVNALALGAILPPVDGGNIDKVTDLLPIPRVATEKELKNSILFLLTNSSYITGEIIHLDGGKHLI